MQRLSRVEVDEALRAAPRGLRLGEHLVRSRKLTEEELYIALSAHAGIPLGRPAANEVSRPAIRILPEEVSRRWRVLPYRVAMDQVHLLTSDVPTEAMARDLSSACELELRFRLVLPRDLDELLAEYLGSAV
jgi:hypothetical protein